MQHHQLVLPEHLNPYGFLFGGYLLKWIDEVAFITVNVDFPRRSFVTIALDDVVFKHRILNGQILRFEVEQMRLGNTSVQYAVKVYAESDTPDLVLFETHITFVCVNEKGTKRPINPS